MIDERFAEPRATQVRTFTPAVTWGRVHLPASRPDREDAETGVGVPSAGVQTPAWGPPRAECKAQNYVLIYEPAWLDDGVPRGQAPGSPMTDSAGGHARRSVKTAAMGAGRRHGARRGLDRRTHGVRRAGHRRQVGGSRRRRRAKDVLTPLSSPVYRRDSCVGSGEPNCSSSGR